MQVLGLALSLKEIQNTLKEVGHTHDCVWEEGQSSCECPLTLFLSHHSLGSTGKAIGFYCCCLSSPLCNIKLILTNQFVTESIESVRRVTRQLKKGEKND